MDLSMVELIYATEQFNANGFGNKTQVNYGTNSRKNCMFSMNMTILRLNIF